MTNGRQHLAFLPGKPFGLVHVPGYHQRLGQHNASGCDFSRTFQPNTNGGTDHAWGSHQLVMGGAVRGGQIIGSFPEFALNGPNDAGNGHWIPQFAVDQYGATLAKWFGAMPQQLTNVFPNLSAFPVTDLGILG
jgi:uncharacterized protein (DUF1501 family)